MDWQELRCTNPTCRYHKQHRPKPRLLCLFAGNILTSSGAIKIKCPICNTIVMVTSQGAETSVPGPMFGIGA